MGKMTGIKRGFFQAVLKIAQKKSPAIDVNVTGTAKM